ncbi:mitochondrial import protein mmp37 [Corchorus capsularis]|uniref:Mitochondrial import protein mmp37 n=1 Tax=Corchorus capsularis TaxID=210143 RepID=A0A1R3G158_COCAP|nr:mitochondrial import protein mmp37 [Corchorus capsularis]
MAKVSQLTTRNTTSMYRSTRVRGISLGSLLSKQMVKTARTNNMAKSHPSAKSELEEGCGDGDRDGDEEKMGLGGRMYSTSLSLKSSALTSSDSDEDDDENY